MGRKHAAKQRRKGHVPYAWGVLGRGGDFDQARCACVCFTSVCPQLSLLLAQMTRGSLLAGAVHLQ